MSFFSMEGEVFGIGTGRIGRSELVNILWREGPMKER
jgi:hypothetical protein